MVLSATAPESAVVNEEFDVTVITPATVTDLKITDEASKRCAAAQFKRLTMRTEPKPGPSPWLLIQLATTAPSTSLQKARPDILLIPA